MIDRLRPARDSACGTWDPISQIVSSRFISLYSFYAGKMLTPPLYLRETVGHKPDRDHVLLLQDNKQMKSCMQRYKKNMVKSPPQYILASFALMYTHVIVPRVHRGANFPTLNLFFQINYEITAGWMPLIHHTSQRLLYLLPPSPRQSSLLLLWLLA